MMKNILNFIKYNNATVFIVLFIFIFGGGVFAAETGALGEKQTRIEGVDNTLLLGADLDNLDMDFRIGEIKEDDKNYYVVYTFIDLAEENNAWQYLMRQKVRKVSKKSKQDLGVYLAEELKEEYTARIKELKSEQKKALNNGKETRVEVIEYSGLLGKALDLTSQVFPGYQPVRAREIISPKVLPVDIKNYKNNSVVDAPQVQSENLVDVYNNYIETHVNELVVLDGQLATSTNEIASTTLDVIIEEIAISTDIVLLEPVTPSDGATTTVDVVAVPQEESVIVVDLGEIISN